VAPACFFPLFTRVPRRGVLGSSRFCGHYSLTVAVVLADSPLEIVIRYS
jgi:hypothetical protein